MPIEIVVNGEPRAASEGQTILDLLHQLNLDPREWPWSSTGGS